MRTIRVKLVQTISHEVVVEAETEVLVEGEDEAEEAGAGAYRVLVNVIAAFVAESQE